MALSESDTASGQLVAHPIIFGHFPYAPTAGYACGWRAECPFSPRHDTDVRKRTVPPISLITLRKRRAIWPKLSLAWPGQIHRLPSLTVLAKLIAFTAAARTANCRSGSLEEKTSAPGVPTTRMGSTR